MLSPFFAWFFNRAKMRSCLRMRFAPSISLVLAISTNSVPGLDLRSDRCMDVRVGETDAAPAKRPHDSIWGLAPEPRRRRGWRPAILSLGDGPFFGPPAVLRRR